MYIYTFFISLILTELRDGVGIRRGSVIGDFPLYADDIQIVAVNMSSL